MSVSSLMSVPSHQERLAALLRRQAKSDGVTPSPLPGVRYMRAPSRPRAPVVYEPSIVIVAQGYKRGFLGERSFTYDANHYLVLSVPMPFECEVGAAPDGPMLGVSIKVDPAAVAELMDALGEPATQNQELPVTIDATPLDTTLGEAAVRLLTALENEAECRLLGPQIVREILFRVLRGAQGNVLRALARHHGSFVSMAKVLRKVHENLHAPLSVDDLARESGMSPSTFHAHFRALTSHSPLQYIKALRLNRARLLMVHEGLTAGAAAHRVGYESASQFSREFRRHFGAPPAEEAKRYRDGTRVLEPTG